MSTIMLSAIVCLYAGRFLFLARNECADGSHNCDKNALCTDTSASYECTCNLGYQGNGFKCVDVNECTAGTHRCDANARCDNNEGSYACTCNSGYKGTCLCNHRNHMAELILMPIVLITTRPSVSKHPQ